MHAIFDPSYWIIVGPTLLIAAIATMRVKTAFAQYARVGVRSGMTGAEAAAAVARAGGAQVRIERHQGFLSDHYDPRQKVLRLSPEVYDGRSVSAVAVGAHEAGHALQDVVRYPALGFRSAMVPVTMFGSQAWMLLFFLGLLVSNQALLFAGILLFGATVVFQLVTLPVEFDASRRAKAVLATSGIVSTQEEAQGVSKVLIAAAMTYVASALTGIATLLYLLQLAGGRSRD